MFYRQCNNCNERWELGTGSTCICPEQEPVAWMNDSTPSGIFARHIDGAKNFGCTIPLYTTPPQRTWVGLTDEEIKRIGKLDLDSNYFGLWYDFAKAIEAKLKEKNT